MKYVRKFDNVSGATAATDLVSPNVTYISGGGKLLMMDAGEDGKELEIKVDASGEPIIEEKPQLPTFTITVLEGVKTYQFEEGMTINQWIASAYNTDGWQDNTAGVAYYFSNDNYNVTGDNTSKTSTLSLGSLLTERNYTYMNSWYHDAKSYVIPSLVLA